MIDQQNPPAAQDATSQPAAEGQPSERDVLLVKLEKLETETRALKLAQEDYARKTNKELMRSRHGKKGSDAEDYASEEAKASPEMETWKSMREMAQLETRLSPEQASYLQRETEGMSLLDSLRLYRAIASAPHNNGETPPVAAPGPGRGPAPQTSQARMVPHPKSLFQYQRLSSEARKSLDSDDGFDLGGLPRFVHGDGGK